MQPHRISVKLYVDNADDVDLDKVIPVFHRWIKESAVPGLLVDVADYTHVPDGPGVILIGHDRDYAMDMGLGRPGVMCTRKRIAEGVLAERIRVALHGALKAAAELERNPAPHGNITFRTDTLTIQVLDRLEAPNTPETFAAVSDAAKPLLDELYEGGEVSVEPGVEDIREPATLSVSVNGAADLATLITRLESAGAPA